MFPTRPRLAPAAVAILCAVAVWVLTLARDAEAKTSFDSGYTIDQTFNAALRLVRVDMGLKITERDPAAAYVMFDYKSVETGQRVVPGSIEMIASGGSVKVVVQLQQMPRYHEQVLADALGKKLRSEYGEPPAARPKPAPAPDGGDEGGATE